MTIRKRLAAVILAALVLFALMTSLFVIIHEADHDCIGENCPVCAVISICQSTLKTLGSVSLAVAAVFACLRFTASAVAVFRITPIIKTPVSLKVRLLN